MEKMMNDEQARELNGALAGADAESFTNPHVDPSCDFKDWHRWVDSLDLDSGATGRFASWLNDEGAVKLRAALHRIVDLVGTVGGWTVRIGKRIMKFVCEMVERFPTVCMAAVILAVVLHLAYSVPVLGLVLGPVVKLFGLAALAGLFGVELLANARERLAM